MTTVWNIFSYFRNVELEMRSVSCSYNCPYQRLLFSCYWYCQHDPCTESLNIAQGWKNSGGQLVCDFSIFCAMSNSQSSQTLFLRTRDEIHPVLQKSNLSHWLLYREGHLPVVKYLAEKGANTNLKDKRSRTPLHIAVRYILSACNLTCTTVCGCIKGVAQCSSSIDHEAIV